MCALVRRLVLVVMTMLGAMLPTSAGDLGLVTGQVLDETGSPLAGAMVTLASPAVPGLLRELTDSSGRYWFRAVVGGHPARVRAFSSGRVPVEYSGVSIRRGGLVRVDFRLRAPGDLKVLAVVAEGIPYHRLALEGALSTAPGETDLLMVNETGARAGQELLARLRSRPSAVLAVGEDAARLVRRFAHDVPIVYAMVPSPLHSDLTTLNLCGVPLGGGYGSQMEHLKNLLPSGARLGTILAPERMDRQLRMLRRAAEQAGFEVIAAHSHEPGVEAAREALDELRGGRIDAFFILMDPRVIDLEVYDEIVRFAESEQVPLIVPDAGLQTAGGSFTVAPGFWEQGAHAGLLLRRILLEGVEPHEIGMSFPQEGETVALVTPRPASPEELLPSVGRAMGLMQLARDE